MVFLRERGVNNGVARWAPRSVQASTLHRLALFDAHEQIFCHQRTRHPGRCITCINCLHPRFPSRACLSAWTAPDRDRIIGPQLPAIALHVTSNLRRFSPGLPSTSSKDHLSAQRNLRAAAFRPGRKTLGHVAASVTPSRRASFLVRPTPFPPGLSRPQLKSRFPLLFAKCLARTKSCAPSLCRQIRLQSRRIPSTSRLH